MYWLIDRYLDGRLDAYTFSNEYYQSYDLTIERDTLSELEYTAFRALSNVSNRFSPFEEDHSKYPGAHYTEAELRAKVIETKRILAQEFATYKENLENEMSDNL